MLVDIRIPQLDPTMALIMQAIGGTAETTRLRRGIYQISHFNFNHTVGIREFDDQYPNLTKDVPEEDYLIALANDRRIDNYFGCYGVCDTYEQVLNQCIELRDHVETPYVMSVTRIRRDEQPADGGWRWHKWGDYIGTQQPQHEYIYDERDIDEVYCYHIYQAPKELIFETVPVSLQALRFTDGANDAT